MGVKLRAAQAPLEALWALASAAMGEGPRTLELDNGAGPDRAERGCVLT